MTDPKQELSPQEAIVELEWVFRTAEVMRTGGSYCYRHGLVVPSCTKCPYPAGFPNLERFQARAMAILAPHGPTIPKDLR